MAIVYLITNKLDDKKYVGKTERSLDVRWKQHVNCSKYGSSLYVHRAMRKYGVEAFNVSMLEVQQSKNCQ